MSRRKPALHSEMSWRNIKREYWTALFNLHVENFRLKSRRIIKRKFLRRQRDAILIEQKYWFSVARLSAARCHHPNFS